MGLQKVLLEAVLCGKTRYSLQDFRLETVQYFYRWAMTQFVFLRLVYDTANEIRA